MNRTIRIALAENALTLSAIARSQGLDYDRLSRVVNGLRRPRPEEIEALARELDLDPGTLGQVLTETTE